MRPKKISILLLVSIFAREMVFAQPPPVKMDSAYIYNGIKSYSKRNQFNRFMYSLIFRPVTIPRKNKKKVYRKLIKKPYSAFEGKTIRHIDIITLSPFGYSISDTIPAKRNLITKTGNHLHVKTQAFTIRNLLLIRQNQPFDSLLVKESERLVRAMGFVRDVSFSAVPCSLNSDSVDIFIRELDNWSIFPHINASTSKINFILTERNFLGFGHEFTNSYTGNYSANASAYSAIYIIPNIINTHINTTLHYGTDEFGNFIKSFAVDRPFFSPFAKWAGGVSFAQQFHHDSVYTNHSLYTTRKYKFNSQDYWAGHAVQIFKGNTEYQRTTNFISTVRFLRIHYLERPSETADSLHVYASENFYMTGIGISTRKYVQDKYIFNYGVTEDIPIGKVYGLTIGGQEKNNTGRLYLGARVSSGNYFPWGYLSSNLEYGTFIHSSHFEQSEIIASADYFTGLFEVGQWKFRQFLKPQITIGLNRFPSDTLTINDGYGLDGFNSTGLSGTTRLLFTIQTQSYSPWNFIGFHFGPFLTCTFGMLGNVKNGLKNSKVYSQIGLGVLIKNENLIINTFQFSISFYPSIPGIGQNIIKPNSFKTTDFGFKDFEIEKPVAMVFQ
jgi:hypothetical protein